MQRCFHKIVCFSAEYFAMCNNFTKIYVFYTILFKTAIFCVLCTLHKYIVHAAMFSQNCMFTAQFRKLQIFCNVRTYLLRKHKNQYLLLATYNICFERKLIIFLTQPLHVFWRKHSAFHTIFYVCSIILYIAKAQSILVPSRNLYNIVSQDAT